MLSRVADGDLLGELEALGYQRIAAWEFRYASGRQRYLMRQLDPVTLQPIPRTGLWSDYSGERIYADYTVGGSSTTVTRRYLPGEWQTELPAADTAFVHLDHLGTTRLFSDDTGTARPDTARLYIAFGVPVTTPVSPLTRYGYAGAWGYEGGPSLWGNAPSAPGFLHVGERHYDPSLGRFPQRDPIGIFGGRNVYTYVDNGPLTWADPNGLQAAAQPVPPYYATGGARAVEAVVETVALLACLGAAAYEASRPRRIGDPMPTNPTPYPIPDSQRSPKEVRVNKLNDLVILGRYPGYARCNGGGMGPGEV